MLFFFVAGIGLLGIVHAVPGVRARMQASGPGRAIHKKFRKALIALLRQTVSYVIVYPLFAFADRRNSLERTCCRTKKTFFSLHTTN